MGSPLLSAVCLSDDQDQNPERREHRPLSKAIPSDSPSASGADPSGRKTRSRTDCVPTRGAKGWSAAGSCPSAWSRDTPQTGTPYRRYLPRNQARGLGGSPAPGRCGACLFIPRTLVFRDGCPSTYERCESRRNSLPRTGNPCLFKTTWHGDKGVLPVGDFVHCRGLPRKAATFSSR